MHTANHAQKRGPAFRGLMGEMAEKRRRWGGERARDDEKGPKRAEQGRGAARKRAKEGEKRTAAKMT